MMICEIEVTHARPWAFLSSALPWHRLVEPIARWRRAQRQQRELRMLDASALRDLALDRSELASYEAESRGVAPCTRRRVADAALPPTGLRPVSALAQFVVGAVGAAAALSAGLVVFGPLADASVLRLAVRMEAKAASAPVIHAAGRDAVRVR